jgi:hypothetical protein
VLGTIVGAAAIASTAVAPVLRNFLLEMFDAIILKSLVRNKKHRSRKCRKKFDTLSRFDNKKYKQDVHFHFMS